MSIGVRNSKSQLRKSGNYILFLINIIAIIIIALLGSGCEEKSLLRVGILPNEEAFPIYVAQEEGIFKKYGVSVEIVPFQSASERDAAIQAGTIDGAEGDMIAVALLRKGGIPVKATAVALGATPSEGRYALLSAPGNITNVFKIKDKTMAISKNTIIEFAADEMLKIKGINPNSVKKVYVPKMPLRLEMLIQKKVDTAVLPEPLASLAELKGAKVLIDDTKLPINLTQSVFFFREDALKKKKKEIQKFLLAFEESGKEVTQNPEKYRDLFNKKIEVPLELQKSFPIPKFSPLQLPNRENVNLVLKWMMEKKLLERIYSYEELVDRDILVNMK
ncbi:MAG: ABC transporter substrate-binding protein [Thermacetogeniaceae bacterium]